jgi:hypothetical protein
MIHCSCGLPYNPHKLSSHLRTKTHLQWATTGISRTFKRDATQTDRYKRYAQSYREATQRYKQKHTHSALYA